MTKHCIYGAQFDGEMIAELEAPRGEYFVPARNIQEVDAEINELCTLDGDKVFMGEMGRGSPYPIFWVEDKDGNTWAFRRFEHLRYFLGDRSFEVAG